MLLRLDLQSSDPWWLDPRMVVLERHSLLGGVVVEEYFCFPCVVSGWLVMMVVVVVC